MGMILLLTFISANVLIFLLNFSTALDSISLSESMVDGKTLVSKEGTFELGFFSPGIWNNCYLGIWYKNIPDRTIVWVANRRNPINGSSGLLKIDDTGNLVLLSKNSNVVVWSSNSTIKAQSPAVQLLDSGNLVLRDKQDENNGIIWQSFDYPCDTLLPGMKLGWDLKTGIDRQLSSWKSSDDPSPGDLTLTLELKSNPQGVTWKGSKKYYRSGPWNGIGFSGAPEIKANPLFIFNLISNDKEVYYSYDLKNQSVITRIVVNQTTNQRQQYTWSEETQSWMLLATVPRDYCDNYGLCGVNGNCIISAMPVCQCLEKFKPKSIGAWNTMDWSQGCVRNKELECQKGDGFIKLDGLKLPDATYSWVNKTMDLKECRAKCLQNCSCMAYTNLDIRGRGSGCAIWFDDLIDIRQVPIGGEDLYVRMHVSEIASSLEDKAKPMTKIAVITTATIVVVLGMLVASYYVRKSKAKRADGVKGKLLDWSKRFNIISGIARGLLYLHQDSRLRIIHRDLKASNVLLDDDMNPKISDFGLARMFVADQTEGDTSRVVGTYGYMAPEYATDGLFSVKSDVFSFGILLLEITSGKKSRGFYHPDHSLSLIGHTWRLWNGGKALELMDALRDESCNTSEVLRCIHISLLCVQQHPSDRPSMASVIWMLGGESVLPKPKEPAFLNYRGPLESTSSSNKVGLSLINEVTVSLIEPR